MEAAYGRAGREPLDLPLPVAHQGGGAHHQGGTGGVRVRLPVQMQGDQSDGLPEPHVVGETAAEAQRRHVDQPVEAAALVVAQRGLQGGGLRHGLLRPGVGEALAQGRQPTRGTYLHTVSVDLRRARQGSGERVDRRDLAVLPGTGAVGLVGVDEHPPVAQAHEGAVGLGEQVQLLPREALAAEGERPAEGEQCVGGQERRPGAGRSRTRLRIAVGGSHLGAFGQVAGQFPRPVHVDAGAGQRSGAGSEQLGDLVVGELDRVRYGRRQQGRERGPGPGRPAQGEQGVHPRARAERGARSAGPHLRGVRDERGITDAVHLGHRPERRPGVPGSRGRQPPHLDTQGQPYARVVARGDVQGPCAQLGRQPGLPRGVGGPGRQEFGCGGAGQCVRDRVQEGAHQAFRVGQAQGTGVVEGDRVRLGRHGGGEMADPLDPLRVQRTHAPGVVLGRGQTGQQQPARHQVQGLDGDRSPEHRRPMSVHAGTRACEHRKGGPYREQHGRHAHRLHAVVVGQYDGQVSRPPRRDDAGCVAVGPPEGDGAGAGWIAGQEDGAAVDECGDLGGGRKSVLRSDDVFLKFD